MKKVSLLLAVLVLLSCLSGCTEGKTEETMLVQEILLESREERPYGVFPWNSEYLVTTINTNMEAGLWCYDRDFTNGREFVPDVSGLDPHDLAWNVPGVWGENLFLMEHTQEDRRTLHRFDSQGNRLDSVSLEQPENIWDGGVLDALYVREDRIILASGTGIQICDRAGKTLQELTKSGKDPYYISGSCVGDALYYVCTEVETPALRKLDLETGEILWEVPFTPTSSIDGLSYSESEQRIFVRSQNRVWTFTPEGEQLPGTLDLRRYNALPGTPVDYYKGIYSLVAERGDTMVLVHVGPDTGTVLRIRPATEEEQKALPKDLPVLRVFFPYYSQSMDDILFTFGVQHQARVETEYYAESFLDFNVADYLQTVSMRILSGNCGWDIMSTELIPFQQYAENGYLADLYPLAPELLDDEIYYTNLLKACEQKDGLYYLPFSVGFSSMTGMTGELPKNTEDFRALCLLPETNLNSDSFTKEINMQSLLNAWTPDFCSTKPGEVRFDRERYLDVLNILTELYALPSGETEPTMILNDESLIASLDSFLGVDYGLIPTFSGVHPFQIIKGAAVMADSPEKELAAQLLCALEAGERDFFPIRRDLIQEKMEALREHYKSFSLPDADRVDLLEDRVETLYTSFDTLNATETNLSIVLYEQTHACCSGEITPEAAANAVENSMNLYRQELGE